MSTYNRICKETQLTKENKGQLPRFLQSDHELSPLPLHTPHNQQDSHKSAPAALRKSRPVDSSRKLLIRSDRASLARVITNPGLNGSMYVYTTLSINYTFPIPQ
jgi:hypothetical protein